jgi:acyl-coenzyme A synthetase/AMP-(fatty) acid ligase
MLRIVSISQIYQWARVQPEKTALIYNDVPYSYAMFARAIEATRGFLACRNLPAGQTAIVLARSIYDGWLSIMALRSLGLNTICVASLKEAESLNIRNVACVVLPQAELATQKLSEEAFARVEFIVLPTAIYAGIDKGDAPVPPKDMSPYGGHILYTSGTTGIYKKVFVDGAHEKKRNQWRARTRSYDQNALQHGVDFPLWTATGFRTPLAVWHVGGSVVFDQQPNRFNRFFKYPITSAFLTAVYLRQLLNQNEALTQRSHGFELVVGAGFLPRDLAEKATSRLTRNLFASYASTECTSIMLSQFKSIDDLNWFFPVTDRVVEIVDSGGNEVAMGEEGELRVRLLDFDANCYLDDAEATQKFFHDGYFYPGDLAVRRGDSRIRIVGRVADVLNVQGLKFAVAPMEHKIQQFLGVSAVCLFSQLSSTGEEELVVAIEADQAPTQDKLLIARRGIQHFDRVRFQVFKKFPSTEAGMEKIKRTALRKLIFGAT